MALLRFIARSLVFGGIACACLADLRGQTSTEASQPQVLFSFDRKDAAASEVAAATPAVESQVSVQSAELTPPAPLPQSIVHNDPAVQTASRVDSPATEMPKDSRRLAPLSREDFGIGELAEKNRAAKLPFEIPKLDSLGTAGAGLVLVVGLFLLCVTLVRRGGPSPTSPLPRDAVAVLGRVPLMPKQFAHLLQVGNKLVLVSISGDRTDTITEITEPAEVDRLLALCLRGSRHSTSADFQRVLGQMTKEPARGFLGREAATAYGRSGRG